MLLAIMYLILSFVFLFTATVSTKLENSWQLGWLSGCLFSLFVLQTLESERKKKEIKRNETINNLYAEKIKKIDELEKKNLEINTELTTIKTVLSIKDIKI